VEVDTSSEGLRVVGLGFADGQKVIGNESGVDHQYIFCPGETVGTLKKLGFTEPAYTAFAGTSLFLTIPLTQEEIELYKNFSHCMEVRQEGVVLAWQARFKENTIQIGVAGTKAFYGEQLPSNNEAFAKNRQLLQLNMINNVLPQFVSLACGRSTLGQTLTSEDLFALEKKGIAKRWVGRRAVAYDGFPTLGALFHGEHKVVNARCTTHLGSGGVAFGPGAVTLSRGAQGLTDDAVVQKILNYADSRRSPK
jgi:hypothetical protein